MRLGVRGMEREVFGVLGLRAEPLRLLEMPPCLDERTLRARLAGRAHGEGEENARREAAEMLAVGDARRSRSELNEGPHDLQREPEEHGDDRRNVRSPRPVYALERHEDPVGDPDPAPGEPDEAGAENPRRGAGCPDDPVREILGRREGRENRVKVRPGGRGDHEDRVEAERPEPRLERAAEEHEVNHVADKMQPATVEKCVGECRGERGIGGLEDEKGEVPPPSDRSVFI